MIVGEAQGQGGGVGAKISVGKTNNGHSWKLAGLFLETPVMQFLSLAQEE